MACYSTPQPERNDHATARLSEEEMRIARRLIPRDTWDYERGILTAAEFEARFRQFITPTL